MPVKSRVRQEMRELIESSRRRTSEMRCEQEVRNDMHEKPYKSGRRGGHERADTERQASERAERRRTER